MRLILHNFFRSSTSTRVRAALNLKGLDYEYVAYALRAGEHRHPDYLALNPQGKVPTLLTPDGPLAQSLAIIEWLDETFPDPPLLPATAWGRARVRSLAQTIALDVHPLNNLPVLFYLRDNFSASDEVQARWFAHWVTSAFEALETRLSAEPETGKFCHGDTVSLADLCLFAQVLNNRRFDIALDPYPTLKRIHAACLEVPEIAAAAPELQPDAT
mgnify:CR=1 FL=1